MTQRGMVGNSKRLEVFKPMRVVAVTQRGMVWNSRSVEGFEPMRVVFAQKGIAWNSGSFRPIIVALVA